MPQARVTQTGESKIARALSDPVFKSVPDQLMKRIAEELELISSAKFLSNTGAQKSDHSNLRSWMLVKGPNWLEAHDMAQDTMEETIKGDLSGTSVFNEMGNAVISKVLALERISGRSKAADRLWDITAELMKEALDKSIDATTVIDAPYLAQNARRDMIYYTITLLVGDQLPDRYLDHAAARKEVWVNLGYAVLGDMGEATGGELVIYGLGDTGTTHSSAARLRTTD